MMLWKIIVRIGAGEEWIRNWGKWYGFLLGQTHVRCEETVKVSIIIVRQNTSKRNRVIRKYVGWGASYLAKYILDNEI